MLKNVAVFLASALLGAFFIVSANIGVAADPAKEGAGGGMPMGAMPVSVAVVEQRDVTQWKEFSGRLRAVEDVEIHPRVSGTIDEVHFHEGDIVEKGTKLFTIDIRPYKANYAKAEAALSSAKARANLSYNDLKRAKSLFEEKAISQRELDEKNSAQADAAATVKSAEAQKDLAALDLEYAEVKAPITGRVGRADITVGNMVQAGTAVMTTMQSVTPVYADFDMDEQTYLGIVKSVRGDNKGAEMPVFMALADETEFKRAGRIRSFDNQLKEDSGTLRVRAEFDNPDGLLTPGLFARVRLGSADKKSAIVINDSAIGTNQTVRFVYVVDAEGNIMPRPVTLGDLDGAQRVILDGLNPGENIVVNGLMRVHPGMKVTPMMVSMETLQPLNAPEGAAPQEGAPPAEAAPVPETPAEQPPAEPAPAQEPAAPTPAQP